MKRILAVFLFADAAAILDNFYFGNAHVWFAVDIATVLCAVPAGVLLIKK